MSKYESVISILEDIKQQAFLDGDEGLAYECFDVITLLEVLQ